MDSALVGLIGVGAGAVLTACFTFLRDAQMGRQQAASEARARKHAIEENRYEARRDAYVTFAAALFAAIEGVHEFGYDHQGMTPGDMGHEGGHPKVWEALGLVRIIGPDEVVEAGLAANTALNEWAYTDGTSEAAEAAAKHFVDLTRRLLKFE